MDAASLVDEAGHVPRQGPVNAPVVEDSPGIREVVIDRLTRRGYVVAAFPHAESVWDTTQHEVYHVAALDWGLPGMVGIELCRRPRVPTTSRG